MLPLEEEIEVVVRPNTIATSFVSCYVTCLDKELTEHQLKSIVVEQSLIEQKIKEGRLYRTSEIHLIANIYDQAISNQLLMKDKTFQQLLFMDRETDRKRLNSFFHAIKHLCAQSYLNSIVIDNITGKNRIEKDILQQIVDYNKAEAPSGKHIKGHAMDLFIGVSQTNG